MTTTITTDDLLTRLTKEELDELTTTAIESGQTNPQDKAIAGALGEIKLSIDPDALEAENPEILYRLWLSLAIPLLYPRRAALPDKHKTEQDWARDVLKQLNTGGIRGSGFTVIRQPTQPATRDSMNGLT